MTPQYTVYAMDHPDLTVSNFMNNSIGPKKVKASTLILRYNGFINIVQWNVCNLKSIFEFFNKNIIYVYINVVGTQKPSQWESSEHT